MLSQKSSKVFGGTMLIAGTSIGAAMLAMPIMTGLFGFFGTVAIMIACWLFMYWTSTLLLEACMQFEDGTSFLTMARTTLGPIGAMITWVTFLLFFYALVAAYLKGSGHIIIDAIETSLQINIWPFVDVLPILVFFAPFIYFGLSAVDHLNRVLMVGMFLSYIAIISWLLPEVSFDRLLYTNWSFSLLSFSVVVTSFGYQVIIPTLVTYLDRDIKSIKRCLLFGSFIPLVVYFLWELVILGSISAEGSGGLLEAFKADDPLVKILRHQVNNDFITILARAFSTFAIVTSFLGVAQGLFDFLKDGLKVTKHPNRRMPAFILTFLPPMLFLFVFEKGFIALLEYAGALVSIILGIVPILIIWRLRSKNPHPSYRAPGGFVALTLGIIFFAFVVLLVLFKNFGLIRF